MLEKTTAPATRERPDTKDTEYALTLGTSTVVVSPFGASLRKFVVKTTAGDWNVIWGYSGGAEKKAGQGDVLVPFPGRIKDATYEFEGIRYELEKNDKDGPNAIHGFLRTSMFKTELLSSQQAVFSYEIMATDYASKGFPFSLRIEVQYALEESGLTTTYKIKNTGKTPAPAGIGFHPYFRAPKGDLSTWSVQIPAADYIELEKFVPTGRISSVADTKRDFRKGRVIGNEAYNDCLLHLDRTADGFAYALIQAEGSKNRVVIRMDRTFDYVVIYTGDLIPAPNQRPGFALEPMTCAPDAFNRAGWGTKTLRPGAEMSGAYTIVAEVNT